MTYGVLLAIDDGMNSWYIPLTPDGVIPFIKLKDIQYIKMVQSIEMLI